MPHHPTDRSSSDGLLSQLHAGIVSSSAEETEALGDAVARVLPENTVVALQGDLGVGKTTFVRGMAHAWGIREAVTSPTYNLFTLYSGHRQLVHLDAYRLDSGDDVDALMIEDFLEEPWCLAVEWPELVEDWIPRGAWRLALRIRTDGTHTIQLEAP